MTFAAHVAPLGSSLILAFGKRKEPGFLQCADDLPADGLR